MSKDCGFNEEKHLYFIGCFWTDRKFQFWN